MSYQVLARKYRPHKFEEVVGQQNVLTALRNSFESGRIHHAYLLSGTRGVGKTTIARIMAKCLNCEKGVTSNSCGECEACRQIDEGRFVDLIEIDAASRTKVDDTREILENVQYKPTQGRYKVYLIDEVHMLSKSSFNALLKTLEEPPEYVKFILATTDPEKLPVTILSRCIQFRLRALSVDEISGELQKILKAENITSEDAAVRDLAVAARGSMRDALSLTDQAIALGGGNVTAKVVNGMLGTIDRSIITGLVNSIVSGNIAEFNRSLAAVVAESPDYGRVLSDLGDFFHQTALLQFTGRGSEGLFTFDPAFLSFYAGKISPETLQIFYEIVTNGLRNIRSAPSGRAGFDMTVMRLFAFSPKNAGDIVFSVPDAAARGASAAAPAPSQAAAAPEAVPEPAPAPAEPAAPAAAPAPASESAPAPADGAVNPVSPEPPQDLKKKLTDAPEPESWSADDAVPAAGASTESSEVSASAVPASEPAPVPPPAGETEAQAADPVTPSDLSQNSTAVGAPLPPEHPEPAERVEASPSQFPASESAPAPRNAAPAFAQPESGYSVPPEAPQEAVPDSSQEYVIPPGGSSAVPYADYESGAEYAEPQELGPREDGYDDVDMSYINEEHDAAEFLYQSSRDESAPAEEERREGGSGFTGELSEADLIGEIDDDWCADLAKSRISGIDLYVLMSGLRTESSGLWTVTLPTAMQDAAGEGFRKRVAEAFRASTGSAVRLEYVFTGEALSGTPLQLAGQKLSAIKKQAVSDIEAKPGFEALRQLLSLKYDENSVHILKQE
ncbi:MAG: DNA polymerase III subunit gamma/tau [Succinivibrionaceae bacterium]|nr:DNA polymerase III subunit gamma/tau [Succinivibrionaceae bacterium]